MSGNWLECSCFSCQIFEWCHYAKVSGSVEHQLPFQLPSEAENVCDDNTKGSPFDLSIGNLKEMKLIKIYQNVVSEYQSLLTLYAIEKEQATKKGKLNMFPKAFSQWQPEGSKYSESQLNAIIGGPQSIAIIFEQYSVETKQHSHSYLYISKEHHNKMSSVVCCSLPCSGASQTSQEMKFGVIERLYQHSFPEHFSCGQHTVCTQSHVLMQAEACGVHKIKQRKESWFYSETFLVLSL